MSLTLVAPFLDGAALTSGEGRAAPVHALAIDGSLDLWNLDGQV
jgi:hypothetical protein